MTKKGPSYVDFSSCHFNHHITSSLYCLLKKINVNKRVHISPKNDFQRNRSSYEKY